MKIRLDFVTNSSSSSFLISTKEIDLEDINCECLKTEQDVLDHFREDLPLETFHDEIDDIDLEINALMGEYWNDLEVGSYSYNFYKNQYRQLFDAFFQAREDMEKGLNIVSVSVDRGTGYEDWKERKLIAEAEHILVEPTD